MINRHNYEEFFLMYVDDELSAQQRAEVELFAQQNRDLAPELEMLLQTKLGTDEEVMFADKDALLKNDSSLGTDNYEEYFLLYIDNELNDAQKESVEKFVLQHPPLQDAFTLLKQTVLEPEPVIFEDKASLYRKEKRRVVPIFLRYAAAAALVGIAALIWWTQTGPAIKHQVAVVKNKPVQNNKTAQITGDSNNHQQVPKPLPQQGDEIAAVTQKPAKQNPDVIVKKHTGELKNETQKAAVKDNKDAIAISKPVRKDEMHTVIADTKIANADNLPDRNAIVINNNQHSNDINSQAVNQPANNEYAKNTNADNNNSIVKPAVYKELNTDDDENRSLYVGALELNKNKVRGLMKKVGGLFSGKSKNADSDDGKLQIANLQLNTN